MSAIEQIARAVLYEGHILYPYRQSALKNRQPWSFGTLVPQIWANGRSDPFQFHAECLANVRAGAQLSVSVRFLHLSRKVAGQPVTVYGESIERSCQATSLAIGDLLRQPAKANFCFAEHTDDQCNCAWNAVTSFIEISAEKIAESLVKLSVEATNTTEISSDASRDDALLSSLVAAHASFEISGGEFISLLDPPVEFAAAAKACKNAGVYPVLVGEPSHRDQVLASPIILYDYPQIAPESAGDFFDATEMDEMLSLRVLTLTEEEKNEMRSSNDHARAILERTESLPPEQLLKVHGVIRGLRKIEEQR